MSILTFKCGFKHVFEGGRVEKWAPANWGLNREIDVLIVPPGKAYTLLTDHLITG